MVHVIESSTFVHLQRCRHVVTSRTRWRHRCRGNKERTAAVTNCWRPCWPRYFWYNWQKQNTPTVTEINERCKSYKTTNTTAHQEMRYPNVTW